MQSVQQQQSTVISSKVSLFADLVRGYLLLPVSAIPNSTNLSHMR